MSPHGLTAPRAFVYAAVGVILLLLGIEALGGAGGEGGTASAGEAPAIASEPILERGSAGGSGGGLTVHVAGAVSDPGVYTLPAGSRVTDAIKRAGGGARDALTDGINLAAPLADGQQVVVPSRRPAATAASSMGAGTAVPDAPISLGSASAADLETIDGIGPVTAADIIEFRDQSGGIASIEDLDQVPGIGPATIESLRDSLQP